MKLIKENIELIELTGKIILSIIIIYTIGATLTYTNNEKNMNKILAITCIACIMWTTGSIGRYHQTKNKGEKT